MQQLRGLILRGEYAVGDKLPPERKLAEELGVNRASLREAIKSLEHMGLVKTRQGDGTRVLDFMQTAGVELVSHLIPGDGMPNLDVLTDVLEFRRWFGREAARQAAERADGGGREEARGHGRPGGRSAARPQRAAQARLRVLRGDDGRRSQPRDAAAHQHHPLGGDVVRAVLRAVQPAGAAVRKHHRDLIKTIAAKDGESASKIADAYLKKGTEQFLATVRPQSA